MEKLKYYILWMLIQEVTFINRKEVFRMSTATKEVINLMEILPESDQNFALEFIKKLVLAWDPDYTKVTPTERKAVEEAEKDIAENETISHDAINWD